MRGRGYVHRWGVGRGRQWVTPRPEAEARGSRTPAAARMSRVDCNPRLGRCGAWCGSRTHSSPFESQPLGWQALEGAQAFTPAPRGRINHSAYQARSESTCSTSRQSSRKFCDSAAAAAARRRFFGSIRKRIRIDSEMMSMGPLNALQRSRAIS